MQDQGAAAGPVAVPTGTGAGLFDGGSLAALFEVRDRIVPEFDGEIDRYANDLIERFRDLMPAARSTPRARGCSSTAARAALTGLAGRHRDQRRGRPERRAARSGGCATASTRRRRAPRATATTLQALADAMMAARDPLGFVSQNARTGVGDDGLGDRLVLRRPRARAATRTGPT